ncbi:MAG: ABC transporter permease [Microbacteriaceae bacterium]|uniref:ABC transporter permease n=1 Tax=Microbacterium sp. TaxID=51671 RepID=UPI003F993180
MTLYTTTVVTPRRGAERARRFFESAGFALGLPILLLLVWGVWGTAAPAQFFPSPIVIAQAFVDTWIGPAFVEDVLPSLWRLGLGIVLAIVIGVALGTLIGLVRWLRELSEPVLEFFRAVPPPVLIPVVTLLFGPFDTGKVILIVAGSIWPVLLNTIDGIRSVDSVMTETGRSYSLTSAERLRYLLLPAASPRIMAGIRQALSVALILMVISEMFNSSSGFGYRIQYFQRNYLIPEMWSGIVLLGLIGVVLAVLFGFAERRVLRWYHGLKEVERA